MEMNRTSNDIVYNTIAIFPLKSDFKIRFLNVSIFIQSNYHLSNIIHRIRIKSCLVYG